MLSQAGLWLGEKGHGNLFYTFLNTLQVFDRERQPAADPLSRTDDTADILRVRQEQNQTVIDFVLMLVKTDL